MEIARLLHTFGGPALALLGSLPVLLRPRGAAPPLLDGPLMGNHDFPAVQPREKSYLPLPSHIVSGNPRQTATTIFKSPDERYAAGIWTCGVGAFRIDFEHDEFIHLIEGAVTTTDAAGVSRSYRAGEAFVSPRGWSGTWTVTEPVKKHFTWYKAEPSEA
ncbi:cupin domain-containing protein [Methylobacterium radiodurans]|uniref:(S)-ureidoglycine aminohydrolase cupin domain-containing protein n=1 Tax=Methylobacterium radiodurans TaxID=2202828 RepID=A0A2U8VSI0_9HYPH|nr:cupin domain-containing protein [Methylobacterium radiodurans]AWN36749.1 hypothetical protein DK427_14235 [Methylobacterium radiodurans]